MNKEEIKIVLEVLLDLGLLTYGASRESILTSGFIDSIEREVYYRAKIEREKYPMYTVNYRDIAEPIWPIPISEMYPRKAGLHECSQRDQWDS